MTDYKQELRLQVDATFADKYHGANVKVQFTIPKSSSGCSVELAPQASALRYLVTTPLPLPLSSVELAPQANGQTWSF